MMEFHQKEIKSKEGSTGGTPQQDNNPYLDMIITTVTLALNSFTEMYHKAFSGFPLFFH